jgi:uncharacterized protein
MMRMLRCAALLLACNFATSAAAQSVDPRGIASPRPDGWIVDRADLISPAGEAEINARVDAVKRTSGGEIAVVTLPTIGGGDHRQWATTLFNHWGIGDADADNGVLLLIAIDDRAAELILGDGIDSDDQVGEAQYIMDEAIVPRMRAGDREGAIRAAVEQSIQRWFPAALADGSTAPLAVPQPIWPQGYTDDTGYVPGSEVDPQTVAAVAGGGGGLLGLIALVRAWWRRRPRKCDRCAAQMVRLDESSDDAHLKPAEKIEERLGSVDYDLWSCTGCANVLKLRYGTFFTRYAKCPKCSAVTKRAEQTTLQAPTYDASGLARIDEHCEHCGYQNSYQKTLPRKTRSSSSSGFGGGSSSGRGASGRW